MIAPFLGEPLEDEAATAPSFLHDPRTHLVEVLINGVWEAIDGAVITKTDPIFMGTQAGSFKAPATSLGVQHLAPGGRPAPGPYSPLLRFRIGGQKVLEGYVAEPGAELASGWMSYDCYAANGHVEHAINGGVHENIIGLGATSDRMVFGDGFTGWLPVGCVAESTVLTAGPKRGIAMVEKVPPDGELVPIADDPRMGPYRSIHINANVGVSTVDRRFYTSAWIRTESSVIYPASIRARTVLWPLDVPTSEADRTKMVLDWSMPDTLPLGRGFVPPLTPEPLYPGFIFVAGPTITVPANRRMQIRTGLWTARGDHVTAGGRVTWSTVELVSDEGIGVPAGSNAADMVQVLFRAAFKDVGAKVPVFKIADSDLDFPLRQFPEGNRLWLRDHNDMMGSIREYDADVSWYYDSRSNAVYVGNASNFGDDRQDIQISNDDSFGHRILRFRTPSDNMANSELIDLSEGEGSHAEWRTTTDANFRWTNYSTAPTGTLPKGLPDLADKLHQALSIPRSELEIALAPPPGGSSATDWLINGPMWRRLKPGDRPQIRMEYGPYREGGSVQIIHLDADYDKGSLKATVRVHD